MKGIILFPALSKQTKSVVPSKFKSISENCAELIPPAKGKLKYCPFSRTLTDVSLLKKF